MKWIVKLKGDHEDLQTLSEAFGKDNIAFDEREKCFVLSPQLFGGLSEVEQVRDEAEGIVTRINGIAGIFLDGGHVEVSDIFSIDGAGRRIYPVECGVVLCKMSVSISASVVKKDGTVEILRSTPDMTPHLKLAENDQAVASVIRLIRCEGYAWFNMYRICEVVEDDVGGEKGITGRGWATEDELSCFCRTAQPHRHGVCRHEPPKKPMTWREGKSFLTGLIHRWMQEKLAKGHHGDK